MAFALRSPGGGGGLSDSVGDIDCDLILFELALVNQYTSPHPESPNLVVANCPILPSSLSFSALSSSSSTSSASANSSLSSSSTSSLASPMSSSVRSLSSSSAVMVKTTVELVGLRSSLSSLETSRADLDGPARALCGRKRGDEVAEDNGEEDFRGIMRARFESTIAWASRDRSIDSTGRRAALLVSL